MFVCVPPRIMMSSQFLAFTLALLGCLLVSLPQPAKSFTVKLLGTGDSYGEGHGKSSDDRWPIPNGGGDVFPDSSGNKTNEENVQVLNADEMSLNMLSNRGPMTNAAINDYLVRFGYLIPSAKGLISSEVRKEAIKQFQSFSNLQPTGVLDLKTVKQMQKPRCGMVDPVSNSKFANFDVKDGRKWDRKSLTYRIIVYSKKLSELVVRENVAKAFKMWSDVSQLDFIAVSSGPSDLKVRFSPKDHGDGEPFDGEGGVLAHAFYPQSGEVHMDEVENWSVQSRSGINLLFVLVHEIGHALGLGHSKVENAIMGPFYDGYDPNLKLQPDDIAGIQYLYGRPITPTLAPTTQAPTTKPPTTQAPTTQAPTTQAPTTKATTTQAPTTQAPTTQATTTQAPTIQATTTQAPTTQATTTQATTTQAPTTQAPTTQAPTTQAPATQAPTTHASTTKTSITEVPTTKFPSTRAPNPTVVPTTEAWTSKTPTTVVPTSNAPATTIPSTGPYEPKPPNRKFPCPFLFSATMTVGNRTYGFYRNYVFEILSNGRFHGRRWIGSFLQRAPHFVGAAAYNDVTGQTFLFAGGLAFRYTDHKLDTGFPKRLRFFIRAAVMVDNQLIGLSFSHIHYLDQDTMEDFVDGEVSIDDEFPGLPPLVRSAVSYGNGYAYILYRRKVILLDMYTGEMTEEPCYRN